MPPRLTEQYRPGDAVEIYLSDGEDETWQPAIVVLLQHPGVWVRTDDGRAWFVTNGRRIRPRAPGGAATAPSDEPPAL
jgi:hypothetical protein